MPIFFNNFVYVMVFRLGMKMLMVVSFVVTSELQYFEKMEKSSKFVFDFFQFF